MQTNIGSTTNGFKNLFYAHVHLLKNLEYGFELYARAVREYVDYAVGT